MFLSLISSAVLCGWDEQKRRGPLNGKHCRCPCECKTSQEFAFLECKKEKYQKMHTDTHTQRSGVNRQMLVSFPVWAAQVFKGLLLPSLKDSGSFLFPVTITSGPQSWAVIRFSTHTHRKGESNFKANDVSLRHRRWELLQGDTFQPPKCPHRLWKPSTSFTTQL